MNDKLNSLPPRLQGLAALAIALGAALVGLLVARMLGDRFYPVVFPLTGVLAGMGLFQIVSGHSREEIRTLRIPEPWRTGMMMLFVVGGAAGLLLNHVLYGAWW
jgi:hypothetical protein